jgi:signal transduction histidine kinase
MLVAASTLVGLWLRPTTYVTPYLLFFPAVMISAGLCGFRAGLLATVLSAGLADYFFVPPLYTLLGSRADVLRAIYFCLSFAFICWLIEQRHSRSEREHRESLNEFRLLFREFMDHMPGRAYLKDTAGRYLYFTEHGQTELAPANNAVGRTDVEIFPDAVAREIVRQDREVLAHGKAAQFVMEAPAASGDQRCWLVIKFPFTDRTGRRLLGGMSLDITEQKRAEAALLKSEKLASAGRLAATIAHEINNPLNVISNALFLIGKCPTLAPKLREYVQQADREVQRITQIARHTLGFHRGNAAPATLQATALVNEALELLERKLQQKGITLRKQYAEGSTVSGYVGELRQVICNLVANSTDAVGQGGTITLRISPARLPSDGRAAVRITIADNGSGIPREVLPHVFEPFFTTKEDVGTGLGLWVSKQIVEKHGGSLRVRSSSGGKNNGTAVSMLLPSQQAEPSQAQPTAHRHSA